MHGKPELILFLAFLTVEICKAIRDQGDFKVFDGLQDAHFKYVQLFRFPEVRMVVRKFRHMESVPKEDSVTRLLEGTHFNNKSTVDNILESSVLSSKCAADVSYTLINLDKRWSIQMLDSSAKMPDGIIYGNTLWAGSYRECVDVFAPADNRSSAGNFRGQYCSVSWDIKLPSSMPVSQLPLLTGICVPDSCDGTALMGDLKSISKFLAEIDFTRKYSSVLMLKSVSCVKEHEKLSYAAICFITLLCTFGILMVSGTCITLYTSGCSLKNKSRHSLRANLNGHIVNSSLEDHQTEYDENGCDSHVLLANQRNNRPFCKSLWISLQSCCKGHISRMRNILECFSVTINGSKILNTETSDDQLLCLHGIRFLSMAWVILGHTYVHCLTFVDNIVDVIHDMDTWPAQVIVHGTFSVDSFFVMSGFLLTYLFLKKASVADGRIPWTLLYIHRFLRLTPPYAVLIGINTLLFNYFGNGPFWGEESDTEFCKDYWWWNLLYINNFLSLDKLCSAWTWYLANDMQFFMVSTLFLYALWRWPKIGISIVLCLLVGSWITTWTISDRYKIKPMFYDLENSKNYTAFQEETYQAWDKIYSKPYCRIGPYLIGIILAYVLHRTGDRKRFLKSWHLLIGWILAIFFSLSVVYSFYRYEGNQTTFNFYNALSRSSFSLGVAWVIYACLTEHAGTVNAILSHKFWIPLSRLTYCAYLIHPLLMKWYFHSLEEPLHFTQTVIVMHFLGFLLLSYVMGFFAAVVFESPVRNFEKFLAQK